MGAVAADLYVATDGIGVPGRGGEREEVGVPQVDPHPIREAEPDPEARPDAIRIRDAGGPVRIVRDRRLVVGGAETEAPPARRLVAGRPSSGSCPSTARAGRSSAASGSRS